MIKSTFLQTIQTELNDYYPIVNFEVQLFFQYKHLEDDWDDFEFWKRNRNDEQWQKSSYYSLSSIHYIMEKEDDSESDEEIDEENSELSSEMDDLELDSEMNEEDLEIDSDMSDEYLEMDWDMGDL
jgi:hypothetical protein